MIQGLFPVLGNRNSLDAETVLILVYSEFKDFSTTKLIGPTESRTIGRPLISRLGILELPALSFGQLFGLASRVGALLAVLSAIICMLISIPAKGCQQSTTITQAVQIFQFQKKRLACGRTVLWARGAAFIASNRSISFRTFLWPDDQTLHIHRKSRLWTCVCQGVQKYVRNNVEYANMASTFQQTTMIGFCLIPLRC